MKQSAILLLLALLVPLMLRAGDKKAVAVGSGHALVLKTDGSLWAFGRNTDGQLGDGTTDWQKTPVKIMDGVVQVSACDNTSMAVKQDGSLWAWGEDRYGNLGLGTKKVNSKVPVKILDNIKYVQVGGQHSMAIDRNGNLWAWGNNSHGQICTGTHGDCLRPTKVMSGVSHVSGGGDETLVVCRDGSLWLMAPGIAQPRKLMDGVRKASTQNNINMVLRNDGTLLTWGTNRNGQLGDGTTEYRYDPSEARQIMSGVSDICAGNRHAMAIKTDGSLWAWGWNEYGQLGNGTKSDSHIPVKVDDGVRSVACGYMISLWITTDGELRMVGEPF